MFYVMNVPCTFRIFMYMVTEQIDGAGNKILLTILLPLSTF